MAAVELVVVPRASANRVGPYADGALGLPPSRLAVVAGARGRRKRLRVDGLDEAELARRLRDLPSD
jgi:uncharacterized protein YggU (UPF0235/DUF167 family)